MQPALSTFSDAAIQFRLSIKGVFGLPLRRAAPLQ
jgi:hypothetical protein